MDVGINNTDYSEVLQFNGNIVGYHYTMNFDEFYKFVNSELQENLKQAKGILLDCKIHEKQSSLSGEVELVSCLSELISEESEFIYAIGRVNNMEENDINFKIIMTGL